MRKFLSLLALLSVLLTSAVTLSAQDRPNLVELLQNDGRFSTLLAALDAAGLTDALQGDGPYTLLASTDDAIAASLETMGMTPQAMLSNPDVLSQILRYHVVPGRYTFRNLSRGATLGTALAGQRVTFALTDGIFTANDAVISDIDNLASNGVMYAIDSVLIPPSVQEALAATPEPTAEPTEAATPEPTPEPTPVAGVAAERPNLVALLEADGRFSTLLAAIDAAGLTGSLSDGGPFTLLAATDDAFAVAFDTLGMTADEVLADRSLTSQIVLYHVLRGRHLYRTLTGGATFESLLLGNPVAFALNDGILTAGGGGSALSDIDNIAANGVMHVVDSVLLPPSVLALVPTEEPTAEPTEAATPEPTPEATPVAGVAAERPNLVALLEADGRFSTLLAAIDAAGLTGSLSDGGPFTLLAPTDDAFAALLEQLGLTADDVLANRSLTNQLVLSHIIRGRYTFRNLTSGPTLPTLLLGQSVTFSLADGVFAANGAPILDIDNLAANGVMQVVDAVILPPSVQALIPTEEPTAEPTPEPTAAPTEAATPEPTPEATPVAGVAAERPNLIEVLQADGRFSTLLALIDAAGQTETLSAGGPFTLLAPTDDAFAALLGQLGMSPEQALTNPTLIRPVLLYHVVPGRYLYRHLTGGATLPTLLTDESVTFSLDAGILSVNGAPISDIDNLASNGVMYALDAVLLPPAVQALLAPPEPTVEPTPEPTPEATPVAGVEAERPNLLALLEADGRFSTLLAAIDTAGLGGTLSDGGPFTLLAPTDDAFAATFDALNLSADTVLADRARVNQLLLYHVVRGRYTFRNLTSGPTLPTLLLGQSVTFSLADGVFAANDAPILDIDNLASNGVMLVVDAVMLPPDVRATLESNPRVRVANFSPDANSVDVYVNGTLSSMTGITFASVTAWTNVSAGTYEIGVAPAGGDPVATVSVEASASQWLTIVVNGSLSRGTLRVSAIPEDFSPLAEGMVRLSLYNAVEGSDPYNVTVDGEPVVIRLGYPLTLGNNDGYFSADVPAGEHVIQYVLTRDPATVVFTVTNGTLEAGMSYLIAAAGSPGAPGIVTAVSPVP
ncbi:MAG: fasciclin domain-containing protein [Anaerolineae bacterium]|nr:fasciclin domain-containing protein [Anaerolineae bacterium]